MLYLANRPRDDKWRVDRRGGRVAQFKFKPTERGTGDKNRARNITSERRRAPKNQNHIIYIFITIIYQFNMQRTTPSEAFSIYPYYSYFIWTFFSLYRRPTDQRLQQTPTVQIGDVFFTRVFFVQIPPFPTCPEVLANTSQPPQTSSILYKHVNYCINIAF